MQCFDFHAGTLPLLVSMPHVGTDIADDIAQTMTAKALERADTDWHLPQLYGFLRQMGVSTIAARYSRYVIDLNRPDTDTNLYPGQDTTGLCPVDTFFKAPLYRDGLAPDQAEIQRRLQAYWQPYHACLRAELDRLLQIYPVVALWDAHSIASKVPRFFDGKLPDLNLGTADGMSCADGMLEAVRTVVAGQDAVNPAGVQFTLAVNGRFKGGYITRNYGQPITGVHAIQLEMCQSAYMDESAPFGYRPDLAAQVQPLLQQMVQAVLDWVEQATAVLKEVSLPTQVKA
jgi:N-formylglutamate deformylase